MLWPWRGTSGKSAPERRAETRLDKAFPVWVEGERGGCHGVARNISSGGLFIESPVTHPIGTQVRVTFSAGTDEMTAIGEVRYACALTGRPAATAERTVGVRGMGVRFLYFEASELSPEPGPRDRDRVH